MSEESNQTPQEKDMSNDPLAQNNSDAEKNTTKPVKPPKPEEKPFELFIKEELIPTLKEELGKRNVSNSSLTLLHGQRPVVGGECWMLYGEIQGKRKFWLCFNKKEIASLKTIALAEPGSDPSLLESFLIDEKKTTLALLVSRILQRLNGQKWLSAN